MRLVSDIVFDDGCSVFCPDMPEGFQVFSNWGDFLHAFIETYKGSNRPLYAYKATIVRTKEVFVDASNIIVIPWDELENYL